LTPGRVDRGLALDGIYVPEDDHHLASDSHPLGFPTVWRWQVCGNPVQLCFGFRGRLETGSGLGEPRRHSASLCQNANIIELGKLSLGPVAAIAHGHHMHTGEPGCVC
jgi:hypothetical protein